MNATSWTLAPARLAPASLDPSPVKNENSPGFPTSVVVARTYAREIKADRAKRVPWRMIAQKMSISRIEAIRLAHSLDEVLDEIAKSTNTLATQGTETPPSAFIAARLVP